VFVGAILSTVRRAFFVRRRSASGTSQSGYDFKPPGFSHGSSYPENKLLRCAIQICLNLFACLCFSFLDGSAATVRRALFIYICLYIYYLSYLLFIVRNARVTRSTAVLDPPMLGPPHVGHPMNETIAATSEVQSLACLRLPKQQNTHASRDEQGRAGRREAAKAAEEDSPQSVKPTDYS
jgi:hypothetical protein